MKKKVPARRKSAAGAGRAYEEFMSRAYTMELEATERYAQFADQLERHNNAGVAELFRRLSQIETLHARKILDEMGWPSVPPLPAAYAWEGEGPETAPFDRLHYLMLPHHALAIALECEQQAQKYYEGIARSKAPQRVRDTAAEMAEEEREHVRLIRAWLKKFPKPAAGWDRDPDPPRVSG
jgi:rubrerythrin